MILVAALLLDQVLEQLLSQRRVFAGGVNAGDVAREVGDLRVVGDRVAAQVLARELSFVPEHVEGVLQEVLLGHQSVEPCQKLFPVHSRLLPGAGLPGRAVVGPLS